ncbi:MAG: hypothetical protein ACTSSG_13085 [Candidatus Heimdallarchaeaceae archaeon]
MSVELAFCQKVGKVRQATQVGRGNVALFSKIIKVMICRIRTLETIILSSNS